MYCMVVVLYTSCNSKRTLRCIVDSACRHVLWLFSEASALASHWHALALTGLLVSLLPPLLRCCCRGIESCGILAGRLSASDSRFTITTLIVPKQTGTSDTVEMLGEEEVWEAGPTHGW